MREYVSLGAAGLPDSYNAEYEEGAPIVNIVEKQDRIELSYTFPGFFLSDDPRQVNEQEVLFRQVNVSKTGFVEETGKPLLPSFGRYVQIPLNRAYDILVKTARPVTIGNVLVMPSQSHLSDSAEGEDTFAFDEEHYALDQKYPEKIVEVSGPYFIDGYKSLLIHVRPLQYNMANRTLYGYSNVHVVLHLIAQHEHEVEIPDAPESNLEGFGNLFLNPKRNINARLELATPTMVFPFRPTPEFLIIYHNNFEQAAKKLAHWKEMCGTSTETVSINTVGNTVANIKKYIRDRRNIPQSQLRYVLLFGDISHIVSETVAGSPYGDNITDYYYSTPTDPANNNQLIFPFLAVGRIPVGTPSEAQVIVDKIIAYEKLPPADPQYYRSLTVAAYFQDDPPQDGKTDRGYMKTMEDIRSHMISLGYDVERVYVSNNPNPTHYADGTPVPLEVKNAIIDGNTATHRLIDNTSEGQLGIAHRDHGSPDGWDKPHFTIDDVNAVTGEIPSVFYSINCSTGQFDLQATVAFGEQLLRRRGCAPSLIAATRLSHTWQNDDLMKALFDAMWPGVLPTFPGTTASYGVKNNRLGDILNYAKAYLPIKHTSNYSVKDHFEIYHVVGDPTLELWEDQPVAITMWAFQRGSYLFIQLSACPRDAVITIWHQGVLARRIKPTSRTIRVPIPVPIRNLPTRLDVCFKAPGYRFDQVRVNVLPFFPWPLPVEPIQERHIIRPTIAEDERASKTGDRLSEPVR